MGDNGPAFVLDGRPVRVLEVRDRAPGCCPHCMKTGMTALLVGDPVKGGQRSWIVARRHTAKSFVTHHCKDLEEERAA